MGVNDVGLWLMCGLAPAVGDTNSAETGPFGDGVYSLDLLAGYTGFTVNEEDWIPQRAQAAPQRGGGNDIIDYDIPNVTETINVAVTGRTVAEVNLLMSRLERMAWLVREFWTGSSIEPVYLKWKAKGSPGPQYALIYTLNVADRTSGLDGVFSGALAIEAEREPYWRALAPGANPKLWTFEAAGLLPGVDFDYADLELYDGTDHLVNETIQNMHEWDPTDYLTTISKNYVDIPAASIPGDAPALVCVDIEALDGFNSGSVYVANSTGVTRQPLAGGGEHGATTVFNAGDTTTGTTVGADGRFSHGSSVDRYLYVRSALGAFSQNIDWANSAGTGYAAIGTNQLRGKYAVFARLRYVTTSGNKLTVELFVTGLQAVPAVQVSTNSSERMVYMGTVDMPRTDVSPDGTGINATDMSVDEMTIRLRVSGTVVSGDTVRVYDLVFLPLDTWAIQVTPSGVAGTGNAHCTIDATGYFARKPATELATAVYMVDAGAITGEAVGASAVYGPQSLTLMPNRNNRISLVATEGAIDFDKDYEYLLRVNIIPRWVGRRDV